MREEVAISTRQAGLSLVETLIAIIVASAILAATLGVVAESGSTASVGVAASNTDERARDVLDRIARELMVAAVDTFDPPEPSPSPSLSFRTVTGFSGGSPEYGPLRRIELRREADDPDDGVDNDSDGFVDECRIVYVQEPGAPGNEQTLCWARGVREYLAGEVPNGEDDNGNGLIDERGLSFSLERRTLTIRLTLERPGAGGERVTRTAETSVTIRN